MRGMRGTSRGFAACLCVARRQVTAAMLGAYLACGCGARPDAVSVDGQAGKEEATTARPDAGTPGTPAVQPEAGAKGAAAAPRDEARTEAKPRVRYEPTWESLAKHKEVPDWFEDGKFGIYFHWGVYSVPAFGNEWYPRWMYDKTKPTYKHHVETYGDPSEFGYKDFIPMFKAEKFDADEWAELFARAGAKWAGPVAEHHDGFAMWDSDVTPWNAKDMGPKRDLVGMLEKAVRKRGMKFVATFHHAHNPNHFKSAREYDAADPRYAKLYGNMPRKEFLDMWKAKLIEVIDKYEPDLMWFDFGLAGIPQEYKMEYLAYYFNRAGEWGREVAVTYKGTALPQDVGILDFERGRAGELTQYNWLTDTSIDLRSWCDIKNPAYKPIERLIDELVDIVSKNGCLLLNIAPRADGTIPQRQRELLLGMGEWLEINGEAIYGTRPWISFGEGSVRGGGGTFSERRHQALGKEDIRFTIKGNSVYAIFSEWPGQEAVVRSLATLRSSGPSLRSTSGAEVSGGSVRITNVRMLGSDEELKWRRERDGLRIGVPKERPCRHAYVYRIEMAGVGASGFETTSGDGPWSIMGSCRMISYEKGPAEQEIEIRVDGKTVETRSILLRPGRPEALRWDYTFKESDKGAHAVEVGNEELGFAAARVAVPTLGLSSAWRFKKGDDPAWKDPALDDSDWDKVMLPSTWEKHSNYKKDPAYGWYRKRVFVPEDRRGAGLTLVLGKIDDADEVFFNGTRIGGSGRFPPDYRSDWRQVRRYAVPEGIIRYGAKNSIGVRVYDGGGAGGMYEGPYRLE